MVKPWRKWWQTWEGSFRTYIGIEYRYPLRERKENTFLCKGKTLGRDITPLEGLFEPIVDIYEKMKTSVIDGVDDLEMRGEELYLKSSGWCEFKPWVSDYNQDLFGFYFCEDDHHEMFHDTIYDWYDGSNWCDSICGF